MPENPENQELIQLPPEGKEDALSASIADFVEDSIKDAQTLRGMRPAAIKNLSKFVVLLYALLLVLIAVLICCPEGNQLVFRAQTFCIILVVVFAAIPTLILLSVMRAIFGNNNKGSGMISPIQAVLRLIKELTS